MNTPAMTIARLALSVVLNILAVVAGMVQSHFYHDTGAGLATGLGVAFIAYMVSPDMGEVHRIIDALKAEQDKAQA